MSPSDPNAATAGDSARLGRYTLCRELGAGGMASVYLARMEGAAGFEKLVALKTIHPHLAGDGEFVSMFLDEARIASRIGHNNVCTVFDFGEEAGTYYLAMEYLVGEPLHAILNTILARSDPRILEGLPYYGARIIADAAEGLHAAHELTDAEGRALQVVHRDVSPQNLFITYEGAVKVVDFGCAHALERVTETNRGTLKGKVSYASPEQFRQADVDRRTDVWALGVCLWETLTLERLFRRATDMQTVMAVLEEPIPLASEGREWIPEPLAEIAARALQRDPERRYESARDLGRDLRRFIAQTGHMVESAEIADWMRHLFGDGRKRHIELLEAARTGVVSIAGQVAETIRPGRPRASAAPDAAPPIPAADAAAAPPIPAAPAAPHPEPAPAPAPEPGPEPIPEPEPASVAPALEPGRRRRSTTRAPLLFDEDERGHRSGRGGRWALLALIAAAGVAGATYHYYASPRGTATDAPIPEPAVIETPRTPDPIPDAILGAPPETAPPTPTPEPPPGERGTPAASGGASDEDRRRDRERGGPVTTVGFGAGPGAPVGDGADDTVAATGSVRVIAHGGWSQVYEGSRNLGRTPLDVELPVGRHTLRLLPLDREPGDTRVVDVVGGSQVTLLVRLHEEPPPEPPPTPTPPPEVAPAPTAPPTAPSAPPLPTTDNPYDD